MSDLTGTAEGAEALDIAVRTELYRWFVEHGHPPVAAELAATLGLAPGQVEAALERLAAARALVLAPGTPYVWMANPLSALPTPFRVAVGGKRFWGNCIWDALGIIAMLDGTGEVSTFCPDCGEPTSVQVRDRTVVDDGSIVHFAVPARDWWADIGFN